MNNKFDKQVKCGYCEKEMTSIYRSKKFCSSKCRVYFNREKKSLNITNALMTTKENVIESVDKAKKINNVVLSKNNETSKKEVETILINTEPLSKHKLWKEEDPKENSGSFFLKYGYSTYLQIENESKNKGL